MAAFEYGPVELHLVAFDGDRPDPVVIDAIVELVDEGIVRLLDFIVVTKSVDGDVTAVELEDDAERFGLGDTELGEIGIAGEEDIAELAEAIPAGTSAAVVAFELAYAKRLASSLAAGGGFVIRSERIPAPVVNALVEAAQEEDS